MLGLERNFQFVVQIYSIDYNSEGIKTKELDLIQY